MQSAVCPRTLDRVGATLKEAKVLVFEQVVYSRKGCFTPLLGLHPSALYAEVCKPPKALGLPRRSASCNKKFPGYRPSALKILEASVLEDFPE